MDDEPWEDNELEEPFRDGVRRDTAGIEEDTEDEDDFRDAGDTADDEEEEDETEHEEESENGSEAEEEVPTWTDNRKTAPFPFNVETTWVLAFSLFLMAVINVEIQNQWVRGSGLWRYLGHASVKAGFTLLVAALSAIFYDMFLSEVEAIRQYCNRTIDHFTRAGVAKYWEIRLETDRTIQEQEDQLLGHDPAYGIPRVVFEGVREGTKLIFNFSWIIGYAILIDAPWTRLYELLRSSASMQRRGSPKFHDRFEHESPWLRIVSQLRPLFGIWHNSDMYDETWESWIILWSQILLQISAVAFLYLVVFSLKAKSEEAGILLEDDHRKKKFKQRAAYCRSVALHLVNYSAHQLLLFVAPDDFLDPKQWSCWFQGPSWFHESFTLLKWPTRSTKDGVLLEPSRPLGMLVFVIASSIAHIIIRTTTKVLIRLFWSLWAPYIAWRTKWLPWAVDMAGVKYLEHMKNDLAFGGSLWYQWSLHLLTGSLASPYLVQAPPDAIPRGPPPR